MCTENVEPGTRSAPIRWPYHVMKPERIDRIVGLRWYLLAAGVALLIVAITIPKLRGDGSYGYGGLTGFNLASLAIYAFALQKWRTDRGLWMLAALLVVLLTPCMLYFQWLRWKGNAGLAAVAADPSQRRLLIDSAIALVILARTVRFAAAAGVHNWRLGRHPSAGGH